MKNTILKVLAFSCALSFSLLSSAYALPPGVVSLTPGGGMTFNEPSCPSCNFTAGSGGLFSNTQIQFYAERMMAKMGLVNTTVPVKVIGDVGEAFEAT